MIHAVIAVVVLARAGHARPCPNGIISAATWFIVAYFRVGVGLNLAARSKPERAMMSPSCAALFALCAVVALG